MSNCSLNGQLFGIPGFFLGFFTRPAFLALFSALRSFFLCPFTRFMILNFILSVWRFDELFFFTMFAGNGRRLSARDEVALNH